MLGPGVRAVEIDDQPVAGHRDGDMDVNVAVSHWVGIHVDVGLVGPVGPLGDLLGEAAAGVGNRPVHGRAHHVGAIVIDEGLQPLRAELGRTHLGPEVADESGQPVVCPHGQDDVTALDTTVHDLQERVPGTFAPDVLGEDVVATGHRTTGVTVMTLDGGDEDQPPVVVEDRAEDVEVGQVAAPVVGVVGARSHPRDGAHHRRNSMAMRTGKVEDSMNWGMPTERADSLPC